MFFQIVVFVYTKPTVENEKAKNKENIQKLFVLKIAFNQKSAGRIQISISVWKFLILRLEW